MRCVFVLLAAIADEGLPQLDCKIKVVTPAADCLAVGGAVTVQTDLSVSTQAAADAVFERASLLVKVNGNVHTSQPYRDKIEDIEIEGLPFGAHSVVSHPS